MEKSTKCSDWGAIAIAAVLIALITQGTCRLELSVKSEKSDVTRNSVAGPTQGAKQDASPVPGPQGQADRQDVSGMSH